MKHVKDYYSYITEGKEIHQYEVQFHTELNIFDLLTALKTHDAEILSNKMIDKHTNTQIITVAVDDRNQSEAEEEIRNFAKLIKK